MALLLLLASLPAGTVAAQTAPDAAAACAQSSASGALQMWERTGGNSQLPFGLYVMRNSFEAVPRELDEAAVIDGASSWQMLWRVFVPSIRPAIVTTSLGGTDWGVLQAGVTISIVPCMLLYLLLQRYYVSGLTSGAVK
jgi:ABC-type glycerol-3-phosphate transport system permease component